MTDNRRSTGRPENWAPETQLVHGGTLRSQFGETSEALFLTQGFVYDSAEQAEARFKSEDPGFHLQPLRAIPTVAMFEERMRLLEGAEAARATATGMAAVTAALLCLPQGRRPHRRRARAVRLLPLRRRGRCARASASPPRWSTAATLDAWRKRDAAQHQGVLLRDAGQPDARARRHRRRVARSRMKPARSSSSTTCSPRPCCSSRCSSAPTSSSIPRPSTSTARAAASAASCWARKDSSRTTCTLPAPDRAVAEPVQRLGDAEGPGDPAAARARAMRRRPPRSPTTSPGSGRRAACSTAAAPTTRRPRSPSGR